jgi:hypothetical protein
MGRPIIATILSFGLELPLSIGGVAIYILVMHGNLLGVYWWTAISGGFEVVIVLFLLLRSDWGYWAEQAILRQEVGSSEEGEEVDENEIGENTAEEESGIANDHEGIEE